MSSTDTVPNNFFFRSQTTAESRLSIYCFQHSRFSLLLLFKTGYLIQAAGSGFEIKVSLKLITVYLFTLG